MRSDSSTAGGWTFHDHVGRHETPRPVLTPVWVVLDAVLIRVPGAPSHTVIDGLDMTGQVPGVLSKWHKTAKGDWLGEVNFSVPYIDGRKHKLWLSGQLVPAYALRPREAE